MKAACWALLPLVLALESHAMQALDEHQMSDITGEGVGAVFEDFSLFTKLPNQPEVGELTLVLDDKFTDTRDDDDLFVISDIRVHHADFEYSEIADFGTAGGRIGSVDYPFKSGDLVQVSSILDDAEGNPLHTYSALRTEFPGGSLTPEDIANNPGLLEQISDKFDFSLRVDSVLGDRQEGEKRQFDYSLALKGFQFYGYSQDIWSIPYYGIATASTAGLKADALVIGVDPNGALSGNISLNNVDLYLPTGSADQPIVMSTVEVDGREQLQLEMLPLTPAIALKRGADYPTGHLRVKSIHFGDPNDVDLRTALRAGGNPENAADYHYAFQPDVGNTLEVEGINVQHLRITTQEL